MVSTEGEVGVFKMRFKPCSPWPDSYVPLDIFIIMSSLYLGVFDCKNRKKSKGFFSLRLNMVVYVVTSKLQVSNERRTLHRETRSLQL